MKNILPVILIISICSSCIQKFINVRRTNNYITNSNVASPYEKFVWVQRFGGKDMDEGKSIAIDTLGNIYTTGFVSNEFISGTVDFYPSFKGHNLTSHLPDIFIAKSNSSGKLIWVKTIGGETYDEGFSITLDNYGNIYITGSFGKTVDFDPGIGIFNLTAIGYSDMFVLKLRTDGSFVWAKNMGGTIYTYGYSINTDSAGNVYTSGQFAGTADFNPGDSVFNLVSNGGYDIFISKLDSFGNFVWAKNMGGKGGDNCLGMCMDGFENIYITGEFEATVDFDPDSTKNNLTSAGKNDIFISKMNSNGDLLWCKRIGGTGNDRGKSIIADRSGNIYVTGRFQGTVDFDPGLGINNLTSGGTYDIFILKLNSSGIFSFAKRFRGSGYNDGNSITIDPKGNIYTTGQFHSGTNFNPDDNAGLFYLNATGASEIFISKLDSSGKFIWAKRFGENGDDQGSFIITDARGNIYVTGFFYGKVDFGFGKRRHKRKSAGSDAFILKISGN